METVTGCYSDTCKPGHTSPFEELPFWSAPSGLDILNTVTLKPKLKVLDTGSGSSCQLIELALRLGNSSTVFGMGRTDEEVRSINRISDMLHLDNVKVFRSDTDKLPFADQYFDLIVSNAGIRNNYNLELVLWEVKRVARYPSQLVISIQLKDAMVEFYRVMEEVLFSCKMLSEIRHMKEHIWSGKKSLKEVAYILREAGFHILEIRLNKFNMNFLDGTTFFCHPLIRNEFLVDWKKIFKEKDRETIFRLIERKLNTVSKEAGEFSVTVPYAILNCQSGNYINQIINKR